MDTIIEDYYDGYNYGYGSNNLYNILTIAYKIEYFLKVYLIYPLIAINLLGNLLSVLIFRSKPFQKVSVGYLFCCLAIADILNSIIVLYSKLTTLDLFERVDAYGSSANKIWNSNIALYVYITIPFISPTISTYIAIDRCISVVWPKKIETLKSRKLQLSVILSASVVFLLANIAVFIQDDMYWYFGIPYDTIDPVQTQYTTYIYPYINIIFGCALPFVVMCISNVIAVINLKKSKEKTNIVAKRDNRDRRFLITVISLNLMFLVFYTPRYVIELYRAYYRETFFRNRFNIYMFIICDKAAVISDYWKYLNSTLQFIVYIITNKIYREQLWEKILYPYRKIYTVIGVCLLVGTGLGFLIFHFVNIGKVEHNQFCMSTDECQESMICQNTKCVCAENKILNANNSCHTLSNASVSRDFQEIFSKPLIAELIINELPDSFLIRTFKHLINFDIVSLNGTLYNYVFDADKQSVFLFDEFWNYKFSIKLKAQTIVQQERINYIYFVDNYVFAVCLAIYKFDLNGNLIKYYMDYVAEYHNGYYDKENKIFYTLDNTFSIGSFDTDLNKLDSYFYLGDSIVYGLSLLAIRDDEFYIGDHFDIAIFTGDSRIGTIPVPTPSIETLLFDDYNYMLASSRPNSDDYGGMSSEGGRIILIDPSGGQLVNANIEEFDFSAVETIGFDLRNKLVALEKDAIIVFQ